MKGTSQSQNRNERRRAATKPNHAKGRSDDANAFFPDPDVGPARAPDDLAEELGEEFVQAVTTGDSQAEDALNADVAEEIGGPFVETSAADEMAAGTDASNPIDAHREALPRAVGGLSVSPRDDSDTLVDDRLDDDEQEVEPEQVITVKTDGRTPRRRP